MEKNKRILIFNVNWLGDVLFSTAVIRNLRRNYPSSFIACIIPSRCRQILEGNPHLNEIILYDDRGKDKGVWAQLDFVRALRSRHFDTVYLLHRSFSRALICRMAGIPERIGYATPKRAFLLTKRIPQPKKDSLHRIDYYLNVIEKSGCKVTDRFTEFFISAEDMKVVDNFLAHQTISQKDFLVVLNPGGNWLLKRWPPEYWAHLADKVIEELGAKVIITGSQSDAVLVEGIGKKMRHKPCVACGVFNLKQVGGLAQRASVFVTADTGPLHIAASVGAKRIIALFGPTSPELTGPLPAENIHIIQKESHCVIPCYELGCKDNACMKQVSPDEVFAAIRGVE